MKRSGHPLSLAVGAVVVAMFFAGAALPAWAQVKPGISTAVRNLSPATQPGQRDSAALAAPTGPAAATSQPGDAAGDDSDIVAPAIVHVGIGGAPGAGAGVGAARPSNEVVPPASDQAAPGQPGKGAAAALPPVPTPEQLVDELLRSGGNFIAASGNVPSSKDVAKSLHVDKVTMGVQDSRPLKPGPVVQVDAPPDPHKRLLAEGTIVRDRIGHVRRDGGRFLFVFDGDQGASADPPLIMLPNSSLESILSQSHNAVDNVRFRVSGTVTKFQQTNYLLLQMVLLEQNLDRF